jgi:hypothetical protein
LLLIGGDVRVLGLHVRHTGTLLLRAAAGEENTQTEEGTCRSARPSKWLLHGGKLCCKKDAKEGAASGVLRIRSTWM